jgi:hypothetical protein
MNHDPKNNPSKWLDNISQNSWQLELIISGFAIFLMLGALNSIGNLKLELSLVISGIGMAGTFLGIGLAAVSGICLFFLVNLILHVILRGLWISAIGLRSVSGDIDFDELNFKGAFNRYLRSNTERFDDYILKLENLCSIVFAFTFLIVFMLLALFIWGSIVLLFALVSNKYLISDGIVIISVLLVLFIITSLMYFLDFITLGGLKRMSWLEPIYYPIYRFFGWITFARLYRPIYYNLIDNKFGKRAGFFLVPYAVAVLWITSLKIDSHIWYPESPEDMELTKSSYG